MNYWTELTTQGFRDHGGRLVDRKFAKVNRGSEPKTVVGNLGKSWPIGVGSRRVEA